MRGYYPDDAPAESPDHPPPWGSISENNVSNTNFLLARLESFEGRHREKAGAHGDAARNNLSVEGGAHIFLRTLEQHPHLGSPNWVESSLERNCRSSHELKVVTYRLSQCTLAAAAAAAWHMGSP